MRIAAISDRNTHKSLDKAETLADHRSTKIIIRYYIRSRIEFNQITPMLTRSKRLK